MPVTIDKLLGKPLLHSHQIGDLSITGVIDIINAVTVPGNTAADAGTVILADASSSLTGNITITLPDATTHPNKVYKIKKTDSTINTVTVAGAGSDKIDDGNATVILAFQNSAMQVVSKGTNWYII